MGQLRAQQWWGQIIGPHGSGKSTLLETLAEHLASEGRQVERFTLHAGQRRLPIEAAAAARWDASTQVLVDGYEQLSWPNRSGLRRLCRRRQSGLVVTAHRPVGLGGLFCTEVSLPTAQRIVAGLLPAGSTVVSEADVADCFDHYLGNMREVLFALYDLYEQRRSGGTG